MTIVTPVKKPQVYATTDTPMVSAAHYAIKGKTTFICILRDCDGEHHVFCSCRS